MSKTDEMIGTESDVATSYDSMTTEELKRGLIEAIGVSARGMLRAAEFVRRLDEKGEDLSGLGMDSLIHQLRKVAHGQLLPEVVTRFFGRDRIISRVSCLPIPEQQKLANDDPVKLVVYGHDGKLTHRMARISEMLPKQIEQVLAKDHVRSEAEQRNLLDQARVEASRPLAEAVGPFLFDMARGIAKLGRHEVSFADLLAAANVLKKKLG